MKISIQRLPLVGLYNIKEIIDNEDPISKHIQNELLNFNALQEKRNPK